MTGLMPRFEGHAACEMHHGPDPAHGAQQV